MVIGARLLVVKLFAAIESPAPFVSSPLLSTRPSDSSCCTPVRFTRSFLSIERRAVSRFSKGTSAPSKMPSRHLSIPHLHHIRAARNAERLHGVGGHHAHLGIGGGRCGANGVGVELHELAEAPGAGFFVAEHPTETIASDRASAACRNSPPHSARAARSDHSAATATARRRPGTRTRPRSAGPDRAGICRARRCIRSPASPPARSHSAHRPARMVSIIRRVAAISAGPRSSSPRGSRALSLLSLRFSAIRGPNFIWLMGLRGW